MTAHAPEPELDATLAAFERVVFSPVAPPDDLSRLGRPDRFLLYRELVRSRIRDLVASALPRTTELLGRAALDREVDERLSARPPTTRFFREIVEQLIDPEAPRLSSARCLHADDLARLELARWRANWIDHGEPRATEFDFARTPVVAPTMVRLELDWSVHLTDRPLERGRFHVAVYRRRDHVVETRWMSEGLAAILDEWRRGEASAIEGVRAAMARLGREPTPEIVDAMSGLLAELLERGGVLGSVPEDTESAA